MNAILRKLTFLFFLLFLLSSSLAAQQNRFIYIQTDNKQPFYVKLDKKLLSSSTSGHLIIPGLKDGTYELSIGFPKNEWPEQNVTCAINKTDAGYILKNFGEKGWGLFNLQTLEVLMMKKKTADNTMIVPENEADAFSNILANVVNDPSIRQRYVKEDTIQADQKEASLVVNKAGISKLVTDTVPEGISMAYVDIVNGITDTINIFIPYDRSITNAEPEKKKERSNEILPIPDSSKKIAAKPVNSGCKNFASRDDFLNLRNQMVVKEEYEDMINVARERFKKSCFTTDQIKNLSTIFLRDEGKYRFFDAAYPFVSDAQNFASLEGQLSDNYFITKFKAILQR